MDVSESTSAFFDNRSVDEQRLIERQRDRLVAPSANRNG
jgi:hypothetical protein